MAGAVARAPFSSFISMMAPWPRCEAEALALALPFVPLAASLEEDMVLAGRSARQDRALSRAGAGVGSGARGRVR